MLVSAQNSCHVLAALMLPKSAASMTILLGTPTGYDRPFGDGYDLAARHERGGAVLLGPRMCVLPTWIS